MRAATTDHRLDAYRCAVSQKAAAFSPCGFDDWSDLHPDLFPHQRAVTEFALLTGSSAMFMDTGLGKSFAALEWGRAVVEKINRPVIMLAPLAVSQQHAREAERFGIDARAIRNPDEIDGARIYISNYERMHHFDPANFAGVILDESSILKSFTGVTTNRLIAAFQATPYRLCCSATPAPNDHTELGQHSAFLGVMPAPEMLSRWFITDQSQMGKHRLKKPGVRDFWRWVASWARCVSLPSDLGFDDTGYVLPELNVQEHMVSADRSIDAGEEKKGKLAGQQRLFRMPETSATSIHREKRLTVDSRADIIAGCVADEPSEPWVIWCDTDYEADAVTERIAEAEEVRGSMSVSQKEARLDAFSKGDLRVLVTKPSIAGYGLNWQHCARMGFAGISFSYESYYQAVRRCWRFGQERAVGVHIAMADTEAVIKHVLDRKAGDHETMKRQMQAAMREVSRSSAVLHAYQPAREATLPAWLSA